MKSPFPSLLALGCLLAMPAHVFGGDVEQVPLGLAGAHGDAPIRIGPGELLQTRDLFRPPLAITIVAKTDSTNLRLSYTADDIIFNWDTDPTQLRVDGGPASGKNQDGKGRIPVDQYVTIRWLVTATQETIYVDGDLRFQNTGDYSAIYRPISVFGSAGSILSVLSLKTDQQPPDAVAPSSSAATNGAPVNLNTQPTPPLLSPATAPAPIVKMTDEQARAVVLIKGDNSEGTGFLVKTPFGPCVVTNIHVISNNPNLQITTSSGNAVTILSVQGAIDRDTVLIPIKDASYSYLSLSTDLTDSVQPGDEVITPGNSEGGEVMLNTGGKVLAIGPQRIEIDNPIYHGNSGGPVFHVKSGKVIAVVTEAMKVDVTDDLDKASFANRNSAIGQSMRYFGLRVDDVPRWEAYDWRRFQNETKFLDEFDNTNHYLDAFLNAPDDSKIEDNVWRKDDLIVKANTTCFDLSSGGDSSQRFDATRGLYTDLQDIAETNVSDIQNPDNFYMFDRQRAKDELSYRQAILKELDGMESDISRLGGLARRNN